MTKNLIFIELCTVLLVVDSCSVCALANRNVSMRCHKNCLMCGTLFERHFHYESVLNVAIMSFLEVLLAFLFFCHKCRILHWSMTWSSYQNLEIVFFKLAIGDCIVKLHVVVPWIDSKSVCICRQISNWIMSSETMDDWKIPWSDQQGVPKCRCTGRSLISFNTKQWIVTLNAWCFELILILTISCVCVHDWLISITGMLVALV